MQAAAPGWRRRLLGENGVALIARLLVLSVGLLIGGDLWLAARGGAGLDEGRPLPPSVTTRPLAPEGPPLPMPPPEEGDQVQPYDPRTRPGRWREVPPTLPDGLGPLSPSNSAMAFELRQAEEGRLYLLAVGAITPGTLDRFEAFLEREAPEAATVVLDSPGGVVSEAIALGARIREAGFATQVLAGGYCASSCPLVFAGGVDRLASPQSLIGVHRAYATERGLGDLLEGLRQGQLVAAACLAHLRAMGVEAEAWEPALATPWSELYYYTPEELTDFKLATELVE